MTLPQAIAEQIHDVVKVLSAGTKIRSATIYGGVGANPQIQALRNGAEILVALGEVFLGDDLAAEQAHTPQGRTLYGAEVFVDRALRGKGVGRELYRARRRICRALNLKRIIACGRLPGYAAHASEMTADLYCKKVLWGDLSDAVLSFQLREGFRFCGVVEGYLPQDTESCGFASLIVWLNPKYDRSRPTRVPEGGIL